MPDGNTEAAQAMIEWLVEKGLDVESVTCGDCTVKLRRPLGPGFMTVNTQLPDEDDDPELGPDGFPIEEPKNAHAAYAARLWGASKFGEDK